MAIQGTQVPMYTNTPFLYFSNFQFFYMKSKINQTEKKTNKNKFKKNKAIHKTRLTQNNKAKHTSNVNKNKKRRQKK